MINGVSIPVLTPFKFYPADRAIDNGVNFQNVDNTELPSQDWEGVYPNTFSQPVARFWNDYSPGIDFQIQLNPVVLDFADLRAAIIDLDGVIVETLIVVDFFTVSATRHNIRIYAREFQETIDGCYRIKIYENGDDDMYYSEVINLADTHENCYPLEYSNFENDFGLIFTNATAETWVGKILIPLRMFKPTTENELESYDNDVGELTTLRNIPKRLYQIESLPVTTWFAEGVKMMFGCSDLLLNKVPANSEEGVNIEILSESDMMEIIGNVQLNEFTDDYVQDSALGTVTELISSWAKLVDNWDQFDTTGKDIDDGVSTGISTAQTNSISIVDGQWYLLDFTVVAGSQVNDLSVEIDGNDYTLEVGRNVILVRSESTGSDTVVLATDSTAGIRILCSMKKIT